MATKKASTSAVKKTVAKKSAVKKMAAKKAVAHKPAAKKAVAQKSSSNKSAGPKYSSAAAKQVGTELHEMKQGTLKSGRSDKKVTNPKQAIAIGLSKARRAGMKVPAVPKQK